MSVHLLRKKSSIRRLTRLCGWGALIAGLTLIVSPAALAQESDGPVVTVTGGQVQGRLMPAPGGAVFKGIPYAAPPVGDLRWRETQPVKPWTGVLQAGEYGAACPQLPAGEWNKAVASTSKEDCLFLNVWAPEWPQKTKKPVMMWIHGGGLSGGSARGGGGIEPPFDGTNLARHGVVVVTINYRVGLLGMIGHPELTAESPHHASGNYAMFDQIAALKWIRDNIARFGGDPGQVTLFGQSAGARYTAFLLSSPLAKGLIHRAILESGTTTASFRAMLTLSELEQLGVILAAALKAPSTGAVKHLRGLPASEIVAAMPEVRKRLNGLGFDQGIDGYVIPQNPPEVYRSGKEAPVPVIIGNVSRDTGMSGLKPNASPEEVLAWAKSRIQSFYGKYPDLLERALKVYGFSGAPNEVSTYPPYGTIENQLLSDLGHRCGGVTTAVWHSALAPVWHYEFTRSTPAHPPRHSSELKFVWGYLGDQESDESARKLSAVMQQYWTNFVKTGNPNGPGLPVWSKYDTRTKPYVEFSNDGTLQKAALRAEACGVYVEKFIRDLDAQKGQ
jgi:para-nitrobenzyl esterase